MLIVEDQSYLRRVLREFLQEAFPDRTIREAEDGSSALAQCRTHEFGVILMDIGLPDANGIELTAKIKRIQPDAAVIVVSSRCGSVYIERARAAGAFAYVAKDAVYQELLPAVKAALAQRPRTAVRREAT